LSSPDEVGSAIAGTLVRIGEGRPLVHGIVNQVVIAGVADAIRAIGAVPVMASDPEESAAMAAQANAIVANTGTPDPRRFDAMLAAGRVANQHAIPVVLDPAGMGSTSWRTDNIARLLREVRFSAIRGNRSEIAALVRKTVRNHGLQDPSASMVGPVRGIEATGSSDEALLIKVAAAARERTGAVVCISGQTDIVAGRQIKLCRNGHPLMGEVVGTGCILSAVIACFLAVEPDADQAVVQAVVTYGLAGEAAARNAPGPGTFRPALIDALAAIGRERTARGALLEVLP